MAHKGRRRTTRRACGCCRPRARCAVQGRKGCGRPSSSQGAVGGREGAAREDLRRCTVRRRKGKEGGACTYHSKRRDNHRAEKDQTANRDTPTHTLAHTQTQPPTHVHTRTKSTQPSPSLPAPRFTTTAAASGTLAASLRPLAPIGATRRPPATAADTRKAVEAHASANPSLCEFSLEQDTNPAHRSALPHGAHGVRVVCPVHMPTSLVSSGRASKLHLGARRQARKGSFDGHAQTHTHARTHPRPRTGRARLL